MIRREILDRMFELAGIDKTKLHDALRQLGPPPKNPYKDFWHPERPTTGYCYVVAEVVSYHMKCRDILHKVFRIDCGNGESHWFVRLGKEGEGEIVDLTADQSDDPFDYEKAQRRGFQRNRQMHYGMSTKAETLAKKMELLRL
jgi:hypothetical protein